MFPIYTWTRFCMNPPFYGKIYPIHQLFSCAHRQQTPSKQNFAKDSLQLQILHQCTREMWPFALCSSDNICVFLPLEESKWKELNGSYSGIIASSS